MELLENFQDIILVSFGAILGVNTRFIIYKKLQSINLRQDFIILVINITACFFLGVFLSIVSNNINLKYSYELVLLFSIGFLGSFSTFSSFIYDVFDLFVQLRFYRALKLLIISLISGIASLGLGLLLAKQ